MELAMYKSLAHFPTALSPKYKLRRSLDSARTLGFTKIISLAVKQGN